VRAKLLKGINISVEAVKKEFLNPAAHTSECPLEGDRSLLQRGSDGNEE